jgi:hypothetical protein
MAIAGLTEDFQIGRVVSRTFSVISRNVATFLMAALLILFPVIILDFYMGTPNAIAGGRVNGFLLGVVAIVVQVGCTYVLQASLVQGTIADLNGERANLGNALSTGFRLVVPVFIISLLALLGMVLGMVLLVVPGVMLAIAWCIVVPVRVVEGTGISETFGRSRALTKGHRWRIFWLIFIYGIIVLILSLLTTVVTGVGITHANTVQGNIPYIAVSWLLQVVLAVITSVGVAAIYYELRTAKEGISPQQLAAAFD